MPQRPAPSTSSRPAWTGVGPNGDVGPMATGVAGALREQRRRAAGPCAVARPSTRGRVRARGDVDADRRDREQRLGDVAGVQAAGERDRDLAGDRGGEAGVDAHPGPARVRPAGGVEQDAARRRRRGRPGRAATTASGSSVGAHPERLPGRPAEARERGRRLVAAQLDRVGVDGGDDAAQRVGRAGPR